ncbi:hypothetical protein JEQ12_000893 [Ovis aries]|uniref:EF-hand domain-containing protein n=1 Tax=Ovis aries TaxID=9940 RepID=A0A836D9X2_SHEEP|nr:hypothetical protein JEQ12_000893 [Ovis aries]
MLTDLESAINSLIDVYHNYSLLKGNYHAVYRDDLKRLLETECPKFLKKKDADTWFKELDINQDGGINFEEFLVLVIKLTAQVSTSPTKRMLSVSLSLVLTQASGESEDNFSSHEQQ